MLTQVVRHTLALAPDAPPVSVMDILQGRACLVTPLDIRPCSPAVSDARAVQMARVADVLANSGYRVDTLTPSILRVSLA
jgi:hypothetical protein